MRIGRIIVWLLVGAFGAGAYGAPPAGEAPGPYSAWYKELKVPATGGSCCGDADCRHLPVRIVDGHYEVRFAGQWLVVPQEAVLDKDDNPTGDYVSCVQGNYYHDGVPAPRVLCFVKAPRA